MSPDLDHPYLLGYQVGVNLALNAIRDAYLVVDGPNCVIFRTSQIQGNHDWLADLLRSDGLHRVADTDCTTERAAIGDDRLLRERLLEVDRQPDCRLILLSAMSPAAVTGRQYEKLVLDLADELTHPVVVIPCGSLVGDWLHGYTRSLDSLAEQLALPEAEPQPGKVALVGYLLDRNEADHVANLAELTDLLDGMDLELASCWLGGGPAAELARVAEAGTIVSLPYGRKAARRLAQRTGATVVDCDLPLGLDGTSRFLRAVGQATGREQPTEALIERRLARAVPRLEWILAHALLGKRLAIIADPHLAWATSQAFAELGCEVALRTYWAAEDHVEEHEREGPGRLLVNPQRRDLDQALQAEAWGKGLDLIVTNSHALKIHAAFGGREAVPFVELGFPSYYSHALFESPFLGYRGALRLVERIANALSRAQVRREAVRPEPEGQGG